MTVSPRREGVEKHFLTKVFGVSGRNNNNNVQRKGRLLCESSDSRMKSEVLTLSVANVRFPAYTHGSIHRGIDDAVRNIFQVEYLTSVCSQNVTFFQQDESFRCAHR